MGKRIEICGSMGAGKTTLANALALHGFTPVLENLDNPYFKGDRSDPDISYKRAEWFLNEQRRQISEQRNNDRPLVLDFSPTVVARAFIDISANTNEHKTQLQGKVNALLADYGHPDLVIAIDMPAEEQAARLKARARDSGDSLPTAYFERLDAAIAARLAALPSDVPVLHVSSKTDYRKSHEAEKLAKLIAQTLEIPRGSYRA